MTLFKNFKTYQIAKNLYQEIRVLKVPSFMRNQLDRAMLSIILNISEGAGKFTQKDRRKFFYIALGSLREVQACLEDGQLKPMSEIYDEQENEEETPQCTKST